jgi:hypothetical protein
MSARDTHRAQKRGRIKPLFAALICTCAYNILSWVDKWSLPYHFRSLTHVLHSPSHRHSSPFISHPPMPPHSTSPPSHYTSSPACVVPTLSSVSSSHPRLSTWPYPIHYSIPSMPITSSASTSVVRSPSQASNSDPDGQNARGRHVLQVQS